MKQQLLLLTLLSISCLGFTGCQKDTGGLNLVEATGVVTLDGNPVVGATVLFVPESKNSELRSIQVQTGEEGWFACYTPIQQGREFLEGIMAGSYLVQISKISPMTLGGTEGGTNELPERYAIAEKSGFSAEVQQEAVNEFEFKMISESK